MQADIYLSNFLKEYRTRNGISLDEMAARSKVSRSLIYQIEKRSSVPTLTTLQKLADAMGIGLADLLAPLDTQKSVKKGNTRELAPHTSKDGSFVSLPIHAVLENTDIEIFRFHFLRRGEHRALRGQGTCVCIYVEEGQLEIEESGKATALVAGDVAEFFPNRYYTYRQQSRRLAQGMALITKL